MSLIGSKLFEKTLIEPLEKGANKLYVVAGYATAVMVMRHIEFALNKNKKFKFSINLIVGMCPEDGIERTNHKALKNLQSKFGVEFSCNYVVARPAVHSKVYAWFKDDHPIAGFVGSANYTKNAFSPSRREVLIEHSPDSCKRYYDDLIGETANCEDERIPDLVVVFDRVYIRNGLREEGIGEAETAIPYNIDDLQKVALPLVDRRGEVPKRSGLNWGQRDGRERNQAYINIPADIGRSDFFPKIREQFMVVTDDDKQMVCVRAQQNAKGIHTTFNNSLLGEYFRYRLGLSNGQFIVKEDLWKYGRTDVTFAKIDDENYYMDFSVR